MSAIRSLVRELRPHGLLYVGDQLVIAAAHHHALFLDQTVHDALGGESLALRRQAAFEAAHALLGPIAAERRAATNREKLELAADLFAAMGHGRLRFEIGPEGGAVQAPSLHHAAGYLDKYGGRYPSRQPLDAFAAGYCSAAASLAFPSDWGRLEAEELLQAAGLVLADGAGERGELRRGEHPAEQVEAAGLGRLPEERLQDREELGGALLHEVHRLERDLPGVAHRRERHVDPPRRDQAALVGLQRAEHRRAGAAGARDLARLVLALLGAATVAHGSNARHDDADKPLEFAGMSSRERDRIRGVLSTEAGGAELS